MGKAYSFTKDRWNTAFFSVFLTIFASTIGGGAIGGGVALLLRQLATIPPPEIPFLPQPTLIPAQLLTPWMKAIGQQQVTALSQWQTEAEIKRLTFAVPDQFGGAIVQAGQMTIAKDVVALTFDDGPAPGATEQILDILKQENVKATFFWLGQAVQEFPDLACRVVNEGHAVGNHSWHHWYHSMGAVEAASEIEIAAKVFYEATGIRTQLFRPPGGFLYNGMADYALSQKYSVVMWSVASADTDPTANTQTYIHNVLNQTAPGAIILMHDGGGDRSKTVAALPQIITGLRQQGYRFVTIPELLELQNQGL